MEQQTIDWKSNSFTMIRYVAALNVLIGHCIAHFEISRETMLYQVFSYTIGMFHGVPIFFGLSGFLIWASLSKEQNSRVYCYKRFIRIYPELWIAVTISIISIALLYNQYKIGDLVLFSITQSTFLQFWTPESLRGYGCGTPNGSLWTIGIFVQFYVVAWMIFRWIHHGKRKNITKALQVGGRVRTYKWIAICIASAFITIIYKQADILFTKGEENIIYKLFGQTILPYFFMFLTGILCNEYKAKILPLLRKYWVVILALYYTISITGIDIPATYTGFFSGVLIVLLILAIGYRFNKTVIRYDISYGMYLFHMIIVNAIVEVGISSKILSTVIVLIASVILACLANKATAITIYKFNTKNGFSAK